MRRGVLKVGLDVIAPLEVAFVDLEVEKVAITVAEAYGLMVERKLVRFLERVFVDLDQVPESLNVSVILMHADLIISVRQR